MPVSMTQMIVLDRRTCLAGCAAAIVTPVLARQKMPAAHPAGAPTPLRPIEEAALPPGTRDMLQRIGDAARSGRVNALRIAIERNELPPLFERGTHADPISILRKRSADGEGGEMLQLLLRVLDGGCAALVATGIAPQQFLWPAYANSPFERRTAAEKAASWGLVRVADIGISVQRGEPLIHRVIIGADGTWQVFATL